MVDETTQKTQPKEGDPIDIPIPTVDQLESDFLKVALAKHDDSDEEPDSDRPNGDRVTSDADQPREKASTITLLIEDDYRGFSHFTLVAATDVSRLLLK